MSSTSWAIWSAVEAKIASMLKAPISLDKAIVKNKSLKGSKTVKTRKELFCVGQLGRSGILKVSTARGRNRWTWQTPRFVQTVLALNMSRQQFAEAVLSNILYFFNSIKNSRLGNDIACRNFIMRIAFHPRGFTNSGFSYRTAER